MADEEIDEMCNMLSSTERRKLLVSLIDDDRQNLSMVNGVPWDVPDTDGAAIRKRHAHVPKLAECGYVEWDRTANVVRRGPKFDEIRPLLEFLEGRRTELLVE